MVRVTGYQKREATEGGTYFALELQADELEFVLSKNTGRHYATAKRCWISSTFSETTCKMMIGKEVPGKILKEECEPYSFVIEETGEEITRHHKYTFIPVEEDTMEEAVGKELVTD